MAKYTEQAKVEAYLQRALTEQESAILDDIISVVSRIISKYCNRIWRGLDEELDEYTDENEQRIFDGNGQRELHLDEFTSIELLEFLDGYGDLLETIDATDYVTYPLNTSYKNSILLRFRRFPSSVARVRVTANFGSGEAPDEVVATASALVGEYITRASQTGDYAKESIEGYAYELKQNTGEEGSKAQTILKDLDSFRKLLL